MRIVFIRHGDPDYVNDSLTEKGKKEAAYLAEYLLKTDTGDIYCSPYGRAARTCQAYLEKSGKSAETCEWLREFDGLISTESEEVRSAYNFYDSTDASDKRTLRIPWDMLPEAYDKYPELFDVNKWKTSSIINQKTIDRYDHVIKKFDDLLKSKGYLNHGSYYEVKQGSHDTITFFCHLGIECVLMAHLINVSPFVLWQRFCSPTSSISTVYTEERKKGLAQFRILQFGATPHLALHDMETSFSARFCEVFEDDTRH